MSRNPDTVRQFVFVHFQETSTTSPSSSADTRDLPGVHTLIGNKSDQKLASNVSTTVNLRLPQRLSTETQDFSICGFPGFCTQAARTECDATALRDCAQCSMVGAGFFAMVAVLLGLLIVSGNLLVIYSALKTTKPKFCYRIKCSLAVADLLTGIQILFVTIFNFSWMINSTANVIEQRQLKLHGSTQATIGGIFYLVSFTASLYHLVLLALQRLYAIRWPFRYMLQKSGRLWASLACVWICSFVTTTVPLWFPNALVFTYYHTAFIFSIAVVDAPEPNQWPRIVAGILVLVTTVLPYLLMIGISVATLSHGWYELRKCTALRRSSTGSDLRPGNNLRKEFYIFKTVAVMQLGFTITLIPIVVVAILSYVKYLDCNNISLPYLICVYLSMSNSFVNVLVYSVRDEEFRSSLKQLLNSLTCGKTSDVLNPALSVSLQSKSRHRKNAKTSST